MQHWVIDSSQQGLQVNAGQAACLIAEIGSDDRTALASAMLSVARHFMPAHHCTVFTYEAERSPRLLSGAGLADHWHVFKAAQQYSRDFFNKDGLQRIIRDNPLIIAKVPKLFGAARMVVHRQSGSDVADSEYRQACYEGVDIVERMSVLARVSDRQWISTNIYRDRNDGAFKAEDVETFLGLAPLFASCAMRHYAADVDGETRYRGTVTDDIGELCPGLTTREREVLLRLLDGLTTERIAEDLHIRPTTVVTYRTRAYEKLGVRSRRELFATVLRRHGPQAAELDA